MGSPWRTKSWRGQNHEEEMGAGFCLGNRARGLSGGDGEGVPGIGNGWTTPPPAGGPPGAALRRKGWRPPSRQVHLAGRPSPASRDEAVPRKATLHIGGETASPSGGKRTSAFMMLNTGNMDEMALSPLPFGGERTSACPLVTRWRRTRQTGVRSGSRTWDASSGRGGLPFGRPIACTSLMPWLLRLRSGPPVRTASGCPDLGMGDITVKPHTCGRDS